jgi:hypothetical protein
MLPALLSFYRERAVCKDCLRTLKKSKASSRIANGGGEPAVLI